jgi:hypothetical protein
VTVKGAGHSLTAPAGATPATPSLDEINQIILDFLTKYLK